MGPPIQIIYSVRPEVTNRFERFPDIILEGDTAELENEKASSSSIC